MPTLKRAASLAVVALCPIVVDFCLPPTLNDILAVVFLIYVCHFIEICSDLDQILIVIEFPWDKSIKISSY